MGALRKTSKLIGIPFDIQTARGASDKVGVFLIECFPLKDFELGKISSQTGKAQVSYIERAVSDAKKGLIDAIVTLPINKEAARIGGLKFPGHTEFLADSFNVKNFGMMLANRKLKVVLVTTHVPLRQVPCLITKETILSKLKLIDKTLKRPRVAVAALNPHAGEGGLFGDEEELIISPAIEKATKIGINVKGPFPSDTVFNRAINGEFDVVLCMYHDQGLIPIKLLGFGESVNITLGLPIVRTSVDHGTAYDIAGKGIADIGSFRFAVEEALRLLNIPLDRNLKP